MKETTLFQINYSQILTSINLYQKSLMSDINLSLRLTHNNQTYTTKVTEWSDNLLIFEAPLYQLDYILYAKDMHISAIFVSKVALFSTTIKIIKNYRECNRLYYVAQIIHPLEKKQQRKAFRLDVCMDIKYQILPPSLSDEDLAALDTLPHNEATCINVSTGGMLINANQRLDKGTHLLISFTFLDVPITVYGELIDVGEVNRVDTYNHHVKFYEISMAQKNLLHHLIFKKQLLQIKRS